MGWFPIKKRKKQYLELQIYSLNYAYVVSDTCRRVSKKYWYLSIYALIMDTYLESIGIQYGDASYEVSMLLSMSYLGILCGVNLRLIRKTRFNPST